MKKEPAWKITNRIQFVQASPATEIRLQTNSSSAASTGANINVVEDPRLTNEFSYKKLQKIKALCRVCFKTKLKIIT